MSWDAEENRPVTHGPYRIYRCPSMGEDRTDNRTTYVGMAGIGPDAASLALKDKRCGAFGHDRKITIRDVTDGISDTILVIETERDNGPWARGGYATVRGVDPDERPYFGEDNPFGRAHRPHRHRWLRGPVYANVALADGSVRLVGASVDAKVIEALATIAGREEIPPDW